MPPLSSDHRTQAGQGPFSAGLALDETGQSQYQGRCCGAGTSGEKELGIPVTPPPPRGRYRGLALPRDSRQGLARA